MIHSIISWDCSFRNFFHLIDGLLTQEYDRSQFELIFVEQRTKEIADNYNHKLGLKSLWDRYEEVKDKMNIRVIYLGDDLSIPYHLGKCNNKGIELAKGEIISVMDGDLLLPSDFLKKLEEYHNKQIAIVNLFRHTASYPIGVKKENWTEGLVDFVRCLEACSTRNNPIPRRVNNMGPLISAKKKYWQLIGGYDLHPIWSTGISRLGLDANTRLEILLGVESTALPNCFAVHPYHPIGLNRNAFGSQKLLYLQQKLIDWAILNKNYSWQRRTSYTEELYYNNQKFVDKFIYRTSLRLPGTSQVRKTNRVFKRLLLLYEGTVAKAFTIKRIFNRRFRHLTRS